MDNYIRKRVGIFGKSGSGKTTFILSMFKQMLTATSTESSCNFLDDTEEKDIRKDVYSKIKVHATEFKSLSKVDDSVVDEQIEKLECTELWYGRHIETRRENIAGTNIVQPLYFVYPGYTEDKQCLIELLDFPGGLCQQQEFETVKKSSQKKLFRTFLKNVDAMIYIYDGKYRDTQNASVTNQFFIFCSKFLKKLGRSLSCPLAIVFTRSDENDLANATGAYNQIFSQLDWFKTLDDQCVEKFMTAISSDYTMAPDKIMKPPNKKVNKPYEIISFFYNTAFLRIRKMSFWKKVVTSIIIVLVVIFMSQKGIIWYLKKSIVNTRATFLNAGNLTLQMQAYEDIVTGKKLISYLSYCSFDREIKDELANYEETLGNFRERFIINIKTALQKEAGTLEIVTTPNYYQELLDSLGFMEEYGGSESGNFETIKKELTLKRDISLIMRKEPETEDKLVDSIKQLTAYRNANSIYKKSINKKINNLEAKLYDVRYRSLLQEVKQEASLDISIRKIKNFLKIYPLSPDRTTLIAKIHEIELGKLKHTLISNPRTTSDIKKNITRTIEWLVQHRNNSYYSAQKQQLELTVNNLIERKFNDIKMEMKNYPTNYRQHFDGLAEFKLLRMLDVTWRNRFDNIGLDYRGTEIRNMIREAEILQQKIKTDVIEKFKSEAITKTSYAEVESLRQRYEQDYHFITAVNGWIDLTPSLGIKIEYNKIKQVLDGTAQDEIKYATAKQFLSNFYSLSGNEYYQRIHTQTLALLRSIINRRYRECLNAENNRDTLFNEFTRYCKDAQNFYIFNAELTLAKNFYELVQSKKNMAITFSLNNFKKGKFVIKITNIYSTKLNRTIKPNDSHVCSTTIPVNLLNASISFSFEHRIAWKSNPRLNITGKTIKEIQNLSGSYRIGDVTVQINARLK